MTSHGVARLDVGNGVAGSNDTWQIPALEEARRFRLEVVVWVAPDAGFQNNLNDGEPVRFATVHEPPGVAKSHLSFKRSRHEVFMVLVPGARSWYITAVDGPVGIDR